ncbi:MAG: hypothetical protein COA36_08855 [Desulfotalea sp.]|nr:MAG: hypothetical protein COA36_08855 [Desulfotalea sp.]
MKILITVYNTWLGGHVLSAFTTARYLEKAGHTIVFAGGRDKMASVIEDRFTYYEVHIPIWYGTKESYFTGKSFKVVRQLRQILRDENIDIIHAFDARSYIHASIAGLLENVSFTCTLCGGKDPYYNLTMTRQIAVFSDEQKDKMVKEYKWDDKQVSVIRSRVEIDCVSESHPDFPDFFQNTGLDSTIPTLMMISSFDKTTSILYVFDAYEKLVQQGLVVQMVFIGGPVSPEKGKEKFYEDMVDRGNELNLRANRKLVVFVGQVYKAYKLLQNATLVLGVGRSAFEGMIYGKPTIVVGVNGYAGIVCEETIPLLAYYNFSGRNQQQPVIPQVLSDTIKELLKNDVFRISCGNLGKDFVSREIDVKMAIPRIEKMYLENQVSVDTVFRVKQWLSVFKLMIPIWRDNLWNTVGIPIKKILGIQR